MRLVGDGRASRRTAGPNTKRPNQRVFSILGTGEFIFISGYKRALA